MFCWRRQVWQVNDNERRCKQASRMTILSLRSSLCKQLIRYFDIAHQTLHYFLAFAILRYKRNNTNCDLEAGYTDFFKSAESKSRSIWRGKHGNCGQRRQRLWWYIVTWLTVIGQRYGSVAGHIGPSLDVITETGRQYKGLQLDGRRVFSGRSMNSWRVYKVSAVR